MVMHLIHIKLQIYLLLLQLNAQVNQLILQWNLTYIYAQTNRYSTQCKRMTYEKS